MKKGLEDPSHKEGLENACTRCHAPMGMINAFMNAAGNYTLEHIYQDEIGKDGISCTVCHQISDFSDPEFSGNFDINRHKEIYGPFPDPVVQQMLVNTGYAPVHNDQINNSRLCGSCHTLFTHSVDETGAYTGGVFVEQALYHEWENSAYPAQNIGCQTCVHSGKPGSAALTRFDTDSFEPHYEVIHDESQVQIYEFVMGDTNGKVTTILERAHIPLKDNRMVPQGFRADHQNYDTVQVVGRATIDADYFTATGYERITYAIPLSQVGTEYTVKVALHHETVPESWLQQLFDYVNEDDDIKQFKLMYESSDNTPELIASDIKSIMTTSIQNHDNIHLRVYPNPSNGNIWIDGLEKNVSYTLYTTGGKQIRSGTLAPGSNFLSLDLPAGCYFFVVSPASNRFTTRLVVKR